MGGASSDSDETSEVFVGVQGIHVSKQEDEVFSQKQDDDGNEEVRLGIFCADSNGILKTLVVPSGT